MTKWSSLTQYYKLIFSNNFITIDEYLSKKKDIKSLRNKRKATRKRLKSEKIQKYRDYINSDKWKFKRALFIEKSKYRC